MQHPLPIPIPMTQGEQQLLRDMFYEELLNYTFRYMFPLFIVTLFLYAIGALFMLIPLLCIMAYFFRKNIWCYMADARKGMKHPILYTIIRRSHFTLTNQYFVTFEDPNYMHHEVDADFFYNCRVGEIVYIYRAPKCGYTFK